MTIQQTYGGRHRIPGLSAAVETFENEFLWGPFEAQFMSGLVIDGASTDSGNTGYTSILRAGLLMGQVTSTKKLKPWDPTATDGTEYIWGILKESINVHNSLGTDTDRLHGLIVVGGGLLSERLIIPGSTALGLSGNANEYLARAQLRANFMLNDSYKFSRPEYLIHTVSSAEQTSGITLTHAESHRHYYNTGGTLAVALGSLNPYKGVEYKFTAVTATTDNITISSSSSNIQVPGSAAASSLTVDGDTVRLYGTGSVWLVDILAP